jgi:hypothetical protein
MQALIRCEISGQQRGASRRPVAAVCCVAHVPRRTPGVNRLPRMRRRRRRRGGRSSGGAGRRWWWCVGRRGGLRSAHRVAVNAPSDARSRTWRPRRRESLQVVGRVHIMASVSKPIAVAVVEPVHLVSQVPCHGICTDLKRNLPTGRTAQPRGVKRRSSIRRGSPHDWSSTSGEATGTGGPPHLSMTANSYPIPTM